MKPAVWSQRGSRGPGGSVVSSERSMPGNLGRVDRALIRIRRLAPPGRISGVSALHRPVVARWRGRQVLAVGIRLQQLLALRAVDGRGAARAAAGRAGGARRAGGLVGGGAAGGGLARRGLLALGESLALAGGTALLAAALGPGGEPSLAPAGEGRLLGVLRGPGPGALAGLRGVRARRRGRVPDREADQRQQGGADHDGPADARSPHCLVACL